MEHEKGQAAKPHGTIKVKAVFGPGGHGFWGKGTDGKLVKNGDVIDISDEMIDKQVKQKDGTVKTIRVYKEYSAIWMRFLDPKIASTPEAVAADGTLSRVAKMQKEKFGDEHPKAKK